MSTDPLDPSHYIDEMRVLADRLQSDADLRIASGREANQEHFSTLSHVNVFLRLLAESTSLASSPSAVVILFGRLCDGALGVQALLTQGCPGPAAAIVRGLFETAVHLRVLLQGDVAERCRLFQNYRFVERSRVPPGEGVSDEQLEQNRVDLQAVRADYHPFKPHCWCWKVVPSSRMRKDVPDNPSVRELAAAVDYLDYYNDLYWRLSIAVHPTPAYEAFLRLPAGNLDLSPRFTALTTLQASLAPRLIAHTLLPLIDYLNPPDRAGLKAFLAYFILGAR
jgi:hypothetical protein